MVSAAQSRSYRRYQRGVSLLEVLISIVIFSSALIGLAGLQSTGLRDNHVAYMRTQAIQLAQEMADRMRANLDGVRAGHYDNLAGPAAIQSCVYSSAGCSAGEIAEHDAAEWLQAITVNLPENSTGRVLRTGDFFTISVIWDGALLGGGAGTGCSGDPTVDMSCYQLRVKL